METTETKTVSILSIDAWRYDGGWQWNQWWKVGSIAVNKIPASPRKILRFMRDQGFLTAESAGKAAIEDDGYNVCVVAKGNRMPLFAIAYGEAY